MSLDNGTIEINIKQLLKVIGSITGGVCVSYWWQKRKGKEMKEGNNERVVLKRVESKINFGRISIKEKEGVKSSLLDEINYLENPTCEIISPDHLAWDLDLEDEFPFIVSPLIGNSSYRTVFGGEGFLPEDSFVFANSFVLSHSKFTPSLRLEEASKWLRGGPRKNLYLLPSEQKALIITGEQVVPSSNGIIRELVMSLHFNYGVHDILGMPFGLAGVDQPWTQLGPQHVKYIHNQGGCYLGNGGNADDIDIESLANKIQHNQITQVYVLGGIREHSLMNRLHEVIKRRRMKTGLCGIPESIEKDYPFLDRTAGFESGVEGAQHLLSQLARQTRSIQSSITILTLQGDSSGNLAIASALSSRDLDICLLPEQPFRLSLLLEYIFKVLDQKKSCILTVTPGCLPDLPQQGLSISSLIAIHIQQYSQQNHIPVRLQQVDGQFLVRSKLSSSQDFKLSSQLAQNGVHGLMAGFTNFAVGLVNRKSSLIPLGQVLNHNNAANGHHPQWSRLLALTGQPSFI